jgi:hypothetical protein
MPNSIKYNVSTQTSALKKGNFWIGTGDVSKGPTVNTDYWNGITPPTGGYTIYLNKASNGPSIYVAANDSELISLTNRIASTSYTTVNECFNYYASQTDKIVLNRDYESIVTDGLIFNLDAGFVSSYPRNGTTWYDVGGSNNGTLTNGPTYSSDNGGNIVLDGSNDYISIPQSTLFGTSRTFTLMMWVYGQPSAGFSGFLRINGTLMFYNPGSATSGVSGCNYRLAYPYPSVSYMAFNAPVNSWYLLTLTNEDTQTPSYQGYSINGANLTTTTYTGRIEPSEIRVGMADASIVGKTGIIMAYNRVLTNAEILQNYNAQKSRFGL